MYEKHSVEIVSIHVFSLRE